MAFYTKCLFLVLVISSFLQLDARESKFFSKVTKTTTTTKKNTTGYISLSPTLSPTVASSSASALLPKPKPELVENTGYGLYGRNPNENTRAQERDDGNHYMPKNPNPSTLVGEERDDVHFEESSNTNNGNYANDVNGKAYDQYYHPTTKKQYVFGVSEKQGMSDTRFLENGKYYYDVNNQYSTSSKYDTSSSSSFVDNIERNEGYLPNKKKNNNEQFREAKNGISDTRYLNNGRYFYDMNHNSNQNEQRFQEERPAGMRNTRYHFDNAAAENNDKVKHNTNENENENEERGGHNFEGNTNWPRTDEYVTTQGRKVSMYPSAKKFPNEYDTMEEYDREQGYIDPRDVYVP